MPGPDGDPHLAIVISVGISLAEPDPGMSTCAHHRVSGGHPDECVVQVMIDMEADRKFALTTGYSSDRGIAGE